MFSTRALFARGRNTDGTSTSVDNFFKRFKKGPKPIWNIFKYYKLQDIKVEELNNVRTFCRLINLFNVDTKEC